MTQNSQIPEGHKDSPLGIIPKEWTVKKLGEILAGTHLGGNYENAESHKGIPVIKMGNIERGKILVEKILYLPEGSMYNREDVLKEGDLLLNTRNTLELVGKVAIWRNELPLALYNSNLLRMQFRSEYIDSNWYMNYNFNSYSSIKQLRRYATGTTSVAAIYSRDLFNLKIALPSLGEQQKIAEILSVWDEAIEKQTQLITKLETRKNIIRRQLLITRREAPGRRDNNWQHFKLGDLVKIRKGEQLNKIQLNPSNYYPVINGGIEPSGYHSEYNTPANTITISEGGNSCGFVNLITTDFWSGGHSYTLSEKDFIDKTFMFHLLKSMEPSIMCLRVGSGLPNIQIKSLANLIVAIPSTVEEQIAIANILSAADEEINLAKQKLTKLNWQKKGLMQVLLTGKTRVTVL